jgi:hypothetical protein
MKSLILILIVITTSLVTGEAQYLVKPTDYTQVERSISRLSNAESYIEGLCSEDSVKIKFFSDTIRAWKIDLIDKDYIEIDFGQSVWMLPDGVSANITDGLGHIFNIVNAKEIKITGGTFYHGNESDFTIITPTKWDGVAYKTNAIFHIRVGADIASYGNIEVKNFKLIDSWYNGITIDNQEPVNPFGAIISYKNVLVERCSIDLAVGLVNTRGEFGTVKLKDNYVKADGYRNRWTTENMGGTTFTQEVTNTASNMNLVISDCHFIYEGFGVQNVKELQIRNCIFEKNGYWFDKTTNADSIKYSEFLVVSGVGVRTAGSAHFKVDHANRHVDNRKARVDGCTFRNTLQGNSLAAVHTNMQLEGENIHTVISSCFFDDEVVLGGNPGVSRMPIVSDCEFYDYGAIDLVDGGTISNCVFRDVFDLSSNQTVSIDTFGNFSGRRNAIRTSQRWHEIKVKGCDFYNRIIDVTKEAKISFSDCNFHNFTEITIANGTTQPDTLAFNISLINCTGGRVRSPTLITDFDDNAQLNIINHKDLIAPDYMIGLIKTSCPKCVWANNEVLDYATGKPHNDANYRPDLSKSKTENNQGVAFEISNATILISENYYNIVLKSATATAVAKLPSIPNEGDSYFIIARDVTFSACVIDGNGANIVDGTTESATISFTQKNESAIITFMDGIWVLN